MMLLIDYYKATTISLIMPKLDIVNKFEIANWPYIHSSMTPNTSLDFYGPDSKELYDRNLKYAPDDWIYKDIKVKYNFNNCGLRMLDDIDSNGKSLYFSGTSFTMGIGLCEEDRFSEIVSKKTSLNFINYAGPTYTIKIQVLSFFNYLKYYSKPQALIIEYPPVDATTFFSNDTAYFCYHKHISNIDEYAKLYNKMKETNFFYEEANYYRQQLISICKNLGIKLIELTFKPNEQFIIDNNIFAYDLENLNTDNVNLQYARDLFKDYGHPGIQVHKDISEYVLGNL